MPARATTTTCFYLLTLESTCLGLPASSGWHGNIEQVTVNVQIHGSGRLEVSSRIGECSDQDEETKLGIKRGRNDMYVPVATCVSHLLADIRSHAADISELHA